MSALNPRIEAHMFRAHFRRSIALAFLGGMSGFGWRTVVNILRWWADEIEAAKGRPESLAIACKRCGCEWGEHEPGGMTLLRDEDDRDPHLNVTGPPWFICGDCNQAARLEAAEQDAKGAKVRGRR